MLTNPLFLLSVCYNSVLNMKALVGAFNQEKALVGVFSVIVKTEGTLLMTVHFNNFNA